MLGDSAAAKLLLGRPDKGEVILLVGPAYGRMQQMAAEAGIEVREAAKVQDVLALRENAALTGRSIALIASAPEVDGLLDRASFGPVSARLAYEVDRVVYGGTVTATLVHPVPRGTAMRVNGGHVSFRRTFEEIGPDPTVVGARVGGL